MMSLQNQLNHWSKLCSFMLGIADLSSALKGKIFEPLKNKSEFSFIEWGYVTQNSLTNKVRL